MGRFHSGNGQFVGWSRLPNALRSGIEAFPRKFFGIHPERPWIPISATAAIARVIKPSWVCWEVGCGMSTIWLSQRVAHVTSIEANEDWHSRLSAIISKRGIRNIDLRFADPMNDIDAADASLDLLYIDGGDRNICLENGYAKVKRGGYIYMDNWDNHRYWPGAADFVRRQRPASVRHFVDYIPAMVGVFEGVLVQV
jgi:hypothetical protein